MSESCTIYHNPRCSKSRQTLALLEARGIAPVRIERPIVVTEKGVVIGRPPENVFEIL